MENLSKDTLPSRAANFQAAAQTPINTSILDMGGTGGYGYEGVLFIVALDTVVDGCVLTLTAYENTVNSTVGATAVTGGSLTLTALGSSNGMMMLDVIRPKSEFVYGTLTRTGQNATVDCIMAIRYRARKKPVPLDPTILASALSTPEV